MHGDVRPSSPVPVRPSSPTREEGVQPLSFSAREGTGSRPPSARRPKSPDKSMNLSVTWGQDTLLSTSPNASSSQRSSTTVQTRQGTSPSNRRRADNPTAASAAGEGAESAVGEERLDCTNGIGHVSSRDVLTLETVRERPPTPSPLRTTQPLCSQPLSKITSVDGEGKDLQASIELLPLAQTVSVPWTPPEKGKSTSASTSIVEDTASSEDPTSTEEAVRSPFNDSTTLLAPDEDEGGRGQAEVWRRPEDSPNDPPDELSLNSPPEEVLPLLRLSQLLSTLTLPPPGSEEQQRREREEGQASGENQGGRSVLLRAMRSRAHVASAFKVLRATVAPPLPVRAKAERPSTVPLGLKVHKPAQALVSKAATEIRFWLRPYEYRNLLVAELGALKLPHNGHRPLCPGLPMGVGILAALRRSRGRPLSRSKTFYHQWFAVLRYELLVHYWPARKRGHRRPEGSQHDATCDAVTNGAHNPLVMRRTCFASSEVYVLALRAHSLGPERISGSKAFLYKATLLLLRETEDLLAAFKRDFLALRRTRTCKGRTHRTDAICATCSLIHKGNKEMFKTTLQSGAEAMYPVAYLHDFFRAEMERLRQKIAKISDKLAKYEVKLFPVASSALKHFMCKHLARMRASRAEAQALKSITAFRARRLRLLTSLVLQEKVEIRTLYKRFPDLSAELEVFVVEEVTRRKRRREQAAATIQRAFRKYQRRKFRRQKAAEEELRAKIARRVAKEKERKRVAMQRFAVEIMDRYKRIRSAKTWECARETCKGRVWKDLDFFQTHQLLHHRTDFRACAKEAAQQARKRTAAKAHTRELKFVQAAMQKRRDREAQQEEQDRAERAKLPPPTPPIPQDPRGLDSLPVIPPADVASAVASAWRQEPGRFKHLEVSLSGRIVDTSGITIPASEAVQYLQLQHALRLHPTQHSRAGHLSTRQPTPCQRLYPDNSLQAKHTQHHLEMEEKEGGHVPVGASSRCVGPDRRACPYLVLVSTLTPTRASRTLPRPFVVELKRRRTVILGTGARAGVRLDFLLPEEELQSHGTQGPTGRQASACHVDKEHIIVTAIWHGSEWEVTVKDNNTHTGTYLLNGKGLVRVSSLGHTHVHDLDFLLLGRSELPDGSCGYDAIFQFFRPQVPPDPLPSSLRPPLPRLLKPYTQVQGDKERRRRLIAEDII